MAPSRAHGCPPPMVLVLLLAAKSSGYLHQDEAQEEVVAVAGGEVSLPCGAANNPFPGLAVGDEPCLLLWFREGSATPILSADARRGGGLHNAKVWKDDAWDARFSLRPLSLVLSGVRGDHEGVYVCRVDFRQAQTINRQVHLVVVVPPSAPVIRDAVGRPLNSSVTVADGDSLTLLCSAHGGRPTAKVTWWRDGGRLEDEPSEAGGSVLRLGPLDRRDLLATLTCRASNNNISEPLATSVVVDMILGPLSVSIVGGQPTLEAGRPSSLRCVSSGSRPPATLSWWKGTQRLPATADGSASTLTITPVTEDDGQQLSCRAVNEQLPQASLEDLVTLRVLYKPLLTLRLGNRLREDSILENHDVYLECNVAANPPVVDITWLFDGHDLQTNTTAGVIVSNRSLVLQKVGRSARGEYQCAASNALGQSRSAALFLRVQFAPICHEPQKWVYGSAKHEPIQVTCDVEADPPEVTFHWHLNHSAEINILHGPQGATRSVATFVARSEADYGTLRCEARNAVGPQRWPCQFSVVPAGPPEAPGLCTLANQTEDAFQVHCSAGHHGGLPQHFVLEVHDSGGRFRGNVTAPQPNFEVTDLPAGSDFVLVVYSANGKGRSSPVLLTAATLPAAAESLLHQGPEATWQVKFSPVLAVLMALVLGFALLAFVVVVAVRLWTRHSFHKDPQGSSCPSRMNVAAVWLAGSKLPSPVERSWNPVVPDVVDRVQVSPRSDSTEMDTFASSKGLCLATLDQDHTVVNTLMQR
ncbi:nephrin [Ixodes scapularis]